MLFFLCVLQEEIKSFCVPQIARPGDGRPQESLCSRPYHCSAQGGLHEGVTIDYLVELVRRTRKEFPSIHPHYFSAPEIHHAASLSQISVREALQRLYDAGQRTIPGGGAEILSPRVHQRICPRKLSPSGWLGVPGLAHEIGFRTTATMMYGHVETPEDIIEHLACLRSLQDETRGFLSFIPWSYKRENNPLGKVVTQTASPEMYLRIIAFARLFLDNFPHITARGSERGRELASKRFIMGLMILEGRSVKRLSIKLQGMRTRPRKTKSDQWSRQAGFEPIERDPLYTYLHFRDSILKMQAS